MRNIIISAGHSATVPNISKQPDRGVINGRYVEGDLTADLRNQLVGKLNWDKKNAIVDSDYSILKQSIAYFKTRINPKDIAIDLHFNSSTNRTATGTEVFIPSAYSTFERALAKDICRIISQTLGISNRSIKQESQSHHAKLGWLRYLNCENFIVEICFISNVHDMELYERNKIKLVEDLSNCLLTYQNG